MFRRASIFYTLNLSELNRFIILILTNVKRCASVIMGSQ